MLQLRCYYWHSTYERSAQSALNQHGVALGEISGVGCRRRNFYQPTVAVLAVAGGNAFEIMVERVFLPLWIILVPVSTC